MSEMAKLNWEVIKAILCKSYQLSLDNYFQFIDHKPLAKASLSQVHFAQTKNGEDVVLKIKYPGIEETITEYLKFFGATMSESFKKELNYFEEVQNMLKFKKEFDDLSYIITPKIYDLLSAPDVLCLSYLSGDKWQDVLNFWNQEDKEKLGIKLIDLFFRSVLEKQILHADSDSENYRFIKNNDDIKIGLLDFGCVAYLNIQQSLIEIINAVLENKEANWSQCLLDLGFDEDSLEIVEFKLRDIFHILLEPIKQDKLTSIKEWNCLKRIENILDNDKLILKTLSPSLFVFVMKSFQGLYNYLENLNVAINWQKIVKPILSAIKIKKNYVMKKIKNVEENNESAFG